ncbi:Protein of unknown function [Gryllus bimaculatus]|nr:Protein of unknown function [Gryllus bimaculatus]
MCLPKRNMCQLLLEDCRLVKGVPSRVSASAAPDLRGPPGPGEAAPGRSPRGGPGRSRRRRRRELEAAGAAAPRDGHGMQQRSRPPPSPPSRSAGRAGSAVADARAGGRATGRLGGWDSGPRTRALPRLQSHRRHTHSNTCCLLQQPSHQGGQLKGTGIRLAATYD